MNQYRVVLSVSANTTHDVEGWAKAIIARCGLLPDDKSRVVSVEQISDAEIYFTEENLHHQIQEKNEGKELTGEK